MAVVTEPPWINQTSGMAARNGTTSHTISFGFTSTSGNFLTVLVFGAVTHTASGWTEQLQPVTSGELSVFTKTSAGDASITVTHNGSNFPVAWVAYEFPAGTTYVGGIGSTPTSDTFPTLTGLPGVEVTVIAARGRTVTGSETTGDTTWTSPDVEDGDSFTAFAVTDGAYLGTGHRINVTATSFTPAATTTFGGTPATPDREHVVFALNVAAAGGTTVATKNVVTTWNVAAVVTKSVATTWDTALVTAKSVATTWNTAAVTSKPVVTTWNTAATVTKSVVTSWDVAGAATTVTKAVSTTWDTAAPATKSVATTWDVAGVVTKSAATSWDVAATGQVSKSVATTWNTAAVATKATATTWNVFTSTTKAVATSWDTATRASKAVATTWAVDGSPTTGTVVRPNTGTITRPFTGVVARP